MKTPVSLVLMAIAYWVSIYATLMVPQFVSNDHFNIFWVTVLIPNVLRLIVGTIPRLAVDRIFFISTTLITFIITYLVSRLWRVPRDVMKKDETSNAAKFKTYGLILASFVVASMITYYTGIDNSIYSDLGWETPATPTV